MAVIMIRDESVRKLCKEKVSGVLATVIAADGLGPAQQGDALFCADGKCLAGTVGGGENEQQVLKACVALNEKQKVVESRPPLSGLLHACGGTLQVRLDRLDLAREEDLHYFQKLCEPDTADRLLLFGAGHVVRELIWLADRTGFSSLVIDPRKELLPDSELPQTVSRICSPAIEWLADESVTAADRIIIAGPDHATDLAVLQRAAETTAHYIGVMGSSRKIESFTAVLRKQGQYESLQDRLYAPIGIDISSKRPPEVAVSIVAELIAVRASFSAGQR